MDTTTNNVITADSLNQQEPVTIRPKPPEPDYSRYMTIGERTAAQDAQALAKQAAQAEQAVTSTGQDINNIYSSLLGYETDYQKARDQAGVSKAEEARNLAAERVTSLAAERSVLDRNEQAIPIQIEQESQGRGRTVAGAAPLEASRLRENALRQLSIAQQSDVAMAALKGSEIRLQAAKDKAKEIVDIKYEPKKRELAFKEQILKENKEVFEKYDKKRAEAAAISIRAEQRALDKQIEEEKAVSDLIVNASSQGAPQDIVNRAKNAKTPMEAAAILGQYSGDYWGTKYKIAQINKLDADAEETRAKVTAAGGVGSTSQANTKDQAKFLLDTIAQAKNLSDASGQAYLRRKAGEVFTSSTEFNRLQNQVATLKTNLLTMATDPNIKKFFGPQMTEADVRNMQAAGTTLNPEAQTPAELKAELERAQKIFEKFVPGYTAPVPVKQSAASWAQSIQSTLLSPTQGGNYGYQDNTQ